MELLSGSRSTHIPDVDNDSTNLLEHLALLRGRAARVDELEKENVLLRTKLHAAIQESTQWSAKQGTGRGFFESNSTSTKGTNTSRLRSRSAFDSVENLVQHNPELRDLIRSQKIEYRKLQGAHEFLLEKLRESHAVISCLKSTPSHACPSNEGQGRHSLLGTGSSKTSPTTILNTRTDFDFPIPSEPTIHAFDKAPLTRSDLRIRTVSREEARRDHPEMQGKLSTHSSTRELPWQISVHKRRKGNPRSAFQDLNVIANSKHPMESGVLPSQGNPHKSWIPSSDHDSGVIAERPAVRRHRCRSPSQSTSEGQVEIEARSGSQDDCTRDCYGTPPDFHKSSEVKEAGSLSKVPNSRQHQDLGELTRSVPASTKSFRYVGSYSERASYDLIEVEGCLSRVEEPAKRAEHQPGLPTNAAASTTISLMTDDLQASNACGRLDARFFTEREGSQEAVKPDAEDAVHDLFPARKIHDNRPAQPNTSYPARAVDLSKTPPMGYSGPKAMMPLDTIMHIQGIEPEITVGRMENTHDYKSELNRTVGQEAKFISCESAQKKEPRSRACNAMPNASGNHFQEMQHDMTEGSLTDKERLLPKRSCEGERHLLVDHVNHSEYTRQFPPSRKSREKLQLALTGERIKGLRRERHANGRAASPPGYWRTDMPSTQETSNREFERSLVSPSTYRSLQVEYHANDSSQ